MPASRASLALGAGACALAVYLAAALVGEEERAVFLPGATSDGHHQIELACESCHARFGGRDALQEACVRCHGEQLASAEDSHPRTKFTDPRNAERVALLDARWCTTCHVEHQPARTGALGLTLPSDYCFRCHADVGEERPSHAGATFDGCASGGCHNFHDNRALYEDFLVAHRDEPALRPERGLPVRATRAAARAVAAVDAPPHAAARADVVAAWRASAHAAGGASCADCHGAAPEPWRDRPEPAACAACHEPEATGFATGKHGMRLAAGLPPMSPALARLPMKADAAQRTLGCTSCHGAHSVDTRFAAVDACLGCHDDAHSRAYEASPHAALQRAESRGELPAGQGVSCASCHMPRRAGARGVARAHHDQSDNLRPNEKMARTVCLSCHGLGFTLDALADADLVARNFRGRPARSVESIDWAVRRLTTGESPERREP